MSFCGIQRKRLSSQRGTDAAVKCSVPLCSGSSRLNSKVSFHSFPVDPEVRARWLTKIGRDSLTPTENTRVCSRHFRPEDFVVTAGGQRGLQKGVLPVLFPWNKHAGPTPDCNMDSESDGDSDSEMETAGRDHDYCVTQVMMVDELGKENATLRRKIRALERQLETLQPRSRFMFQRFAWSDEDARFYTGFASFKHFLAFWRVVEAAVNADTRASSARSLEDSHPATKLPFIDELLLFLMHLSVGLPLRDLAERFGVNTTTASRIIAAWAHLLYNLLGRQCLWISPEAVRAHLPPEFSAFSDTQVVLDCTEVFCQTLSSALQQSQASPKNKSRAAFKAMIGMAPHGAVTFVSALYSGSLGGREIFKLSGITSLLTPDMAIMVDKGYLIDDLAPCKVHRPAFFSDDRHNPQTAFIRRLRVHVERCIRRVKENKLFDKDVPLCVRGSVEELFSVACYLVNYQNRPLHETDAARLIY